MSKNQNIRLDFEDDDPLPLGLLKIKKQEAFHRFFYQTNLLNPFHFKRIEDLTILRNGVEYSFLRMQSYDHEERTSYQIIRNVSFETEHPMEASLFDSVHSIAYLIEDKEKTDLIIKIDDPCPDFSVILFPQNQIISFREIECDPGDLIYQYLHYNE